MMSGRLHWSCSNTDFSSPQIKVQLVDCGQWDLTFMTCIVVSLVSLVTRHVLTLSVHLTATQSHIWKEDEYNYTLKCHQLYSSFYNLPSESSNDPTQGVLERECGDQHDMSDRETEIGQLGHMVMYYRGTSQRTAQSLVNPLTGSLNLLNILNSQDFKANL